jgi:hypothetical protein
MGEEGYQRSDISDHETVLSVVETFYNETGLSGGKRRKKKPTQRTQRARSSQRGEKRR